MLDCSSDDYAIRVCLKANYNLDATTVDLLSGGFDSFATTYKAVTPSKDSFFVKLRAGAFSKAAITIPRQLHNAGIENLLPPLPNIGGGLWSSIDDSILVVYPYIHTVNAKDRPLSLAQWTELGRTLNEIHSFDHDVNDVLGISVDNFDLPRARSIEDVPEILESSSSPHVGRFADFWREHEGQINDLLANVRELGEELRPTGLEKVVCHSDCHLWNWIVDDEGKIYLVDWDDGPLIAPRERDLFMLIRPDADENVSERDQAFLKGYNKTDIVLDALTYYRMERILEDVAVSANDILVASISETKKEEIFAKLPAILVGF